jgi:hypothetical protein
MRLLLGSRGKWILCLRFSYATPKNTKLRNLRVAITIASTLAGF